MRGMNGVVWRDDVQAVDLKVSKRYAVTPGVVVGVEERRNG
jgi:Holliday junction resolvase RusA-like endonuclease